MTTEQRIIEYMTKYEPQPVAIKDGEKSYLNALRTHQSYSIYLTSAKRNTGVYRTYLRLCFDWLKTLKKNGVNLSYIIKN
jgi:hypothetical protein